MAEQISPNKEHATRRRLLAAAAGAGGVVLGAAVGAFGMRTYDGFTRPDDVPGFVWYASLGFEDPALEPARAGTMAGNPHVTSHNPNNWPNVGLLGTPLGELATRWPQLPLARLGVIYTDPGQKWHEGWAEEGQIYGGTVVHEGGLHLAVAVRQGANSAHFTWALSGERGNTTERHQLDSTILDTMPVGQVPAGIPVL